MTSSPDTLARKHASEVAHGERFEFGKNWASFLDVLDDTRVADARAWFERMLPAALVKGRTLVDIGSGSGLMSLAARQLGAKVTSFDYDPQSVACTTEVRRRYAPDDPDWKVLAGSALDPQFLVSLGQFDIVYSWGVLHHTGDQWTALGLAGERVAPGGRLFVAIYNDQGVWSGRWKQIKRVYCSGPIGQAIVLAAFVPWWWVRLMLSELVRGRNPLHFNPGRGMSLLHDWKDWLGGYPFEVAKPEEIFEFYKARGFRLEKLRTQGGTVGCNEFVFVRER